MGMKDLTGRASMSVNLTVTDCLPASELCVCVAKTGVASAHIPVHLPSQT